MNYTGNDFPEKVYILGCARSGTTMMCHMMHCYENVYVFDDECEVGVLRSYNTLCKLAVAKRTYESYKCDPIEYNGLGLIALVRHPFDVLTSKLFTDKFHVSLDRWRDEANFLENLLESRSDILIIRYEDLIADPNKVQSQIASKFGLTTSVPFTSFHTIKPVSERRILAMRGLRKPDPSSIGRWRNLKDDALYCAKAAQQLGDTMTNFSHRFGYSLDANC